MNQRFHAPAGSLRGPVWGTGSIEHQASRTNGHALEENREGGREGVYLHRCICLVDGVIDTQRHRSR